MKYFTPTKISDNMYETPEGFLVCIGVPIARTGEMNYGEGETPLDADSKGKVVITRDESEVFRAETIASFEGKPLTITHPDEFVNPENWKHLAKGTIQNVRRGEGEFADSLIADILITDRVAIGLVKNGLREVSCGYEADYIQDEDGKGRQTNIIGNHLALVDQGRAGSDYKINDSFKGKVQMNKKFMEKLKARFGAKVIDEMEKETSEKADDSAKQTTPNSSTGAPATASDATAYDELKKMVGDLSTKIDGLMTAKDDGAADADKEPKEPKEPKEKTGDEPASMEDRMKALEAAVAKMLENQAGAGDADEEEEETDDDDFEETTMAGDTADAMSRAEILCPGIEKSKNLKSEALKGAYKTKDGKRVIDSLTGGSPDFKTPEKVDSLFVSASEVIKIMRAREQSNTKVSTYDGGESKSEPMTPERMNEINAKHFKRA